MSDMGDVDIDALLAQTSELAAKASEEVGADDQGEAPSQEDAADQPTDGGPPASDSEADGSFLDDIPVEEADDEPPRAGPAEPEPAEFLTPTYTEVEDDQAETQPEAAAESPGDAEPASDLSGDGSEGVDDKLAELEAMLGNVADGSESAADEADVQGQGDKASSAKDADEQDTLSASEPISAEGGAVAEAADAEADFDDYDDFDISVDLSEDEATADAEIAAKAEGLETSEAPPPKGPVHVRMLEGSFRAVGGLFVVLDMPFQGVPLGVKQALGYVAVATVAVAVGGIVYGALGH